jgi:hypothetical protein
MMKISTDSARLGKHSMDGRETNVGGIRFRA